LFIETVTNLTRIEFHHRLTVLRAERADLLNQLNVRVARQDDTPLADLPHDWGIAGDLEWDKCLLRQLLRQES
jgi:hypothetical protein